MDVLIRWAAKWGVPHEALVDLGHMLASLDAAAASSGAENEVMAQVRLRASQAGWRVFRNNVGACTTDDNRFLRYGLANDSKRINDLLKSSDLIGIRPVRIGVAHLGRTIGQFVALECKRPGWTFKNTKRERAQQSFLALIEALGGHGRFTTGGLE